MTRINALGNGMNSAIYFLVALASSIHQLESGTSCVAYPPRISLFKEMISAISIFLGRHRPPFSGGISRNRELSHVLIEATWLGNTTAAVYSVQVSRALLVYHDRGTARCEFYSSYCQVLYTRVPPHVPAPFPAWRVVANKLSGISRKKSD